MSHTTIIIVIIISSGLLGGLTNFLTINKFDDKKESWINFFKAIALGLSASTTVPLFLQIISNNLLDEPGKVGYPLKNYLIFSGFCVLAAFFSKRFLEDLYEKVNQAQREAKEAKKTAKEAEKFVVSQLQEEQDEVDSVENEIENFVPIQLNSEAGASASFPDEDYVKTLSNFQNSKFKDRSIAGLVRGTKIDEAKLAIILQYFVQQGILDMVRWYGKNFYRLTQKGKRTKMS